MRSPGLITSMCMDCCWSATAAVRVAGYGAAPPRPPSDAVCAWGVQGTSRVPGRELVPVPLLMDGFGSVPGTAVP